MAYSKTYETLIQESLNNLSANTNITQLVPGSKARSLLENFNFRLGQAYKYLDNTIVNQFLSSASGNYLDLMGDLINCPRLNATFSYSTVGAVNVYFYVNSGSFGDLNNGNNITVPAGTLISTSPPGTDPTQIISYRVSTDIVLNAQDTKQYVPVEALQFGTFGAVGSNTLVNHSLANYQGLLMVNNEVAINNGRNTEGDEAYRYRLSLKITGAAMANATAIRLACLSVPGVADVSLKPYAMGGGTFEVIILPTQNNDNPDLVNAVQAAIDYTKGFGCYGVARSPDFLGVQFQANIYARKILSATDLDLLRQQLTMETINYFSRFILAQGLTINNFQAFLLQANNQIRTVGEPGHPFAQFYLWVPSRLNNGRRRFTLVGDYQADYDEIIRLENQTGLTAANFNIINPA